MRCDTENELKKDRLIDEIADILVDVVGWIEKKDVLPNKEFVRDLHIAGDDLTVFATEVERRFKFKPAIEEWRRIGTVEQTAELVLRHNV